MSKTTSEPTRRPVADQTACRNRRVLVLAPFGRDAAEVCRVLSEARLEATRCADADELCRQIRRGAAGALVTEEALGEEARALLTTTLAEQPAWSDFPLLVMVSRGRTSGEQWQAVQGIEGTAYLSLLERPLHVATLITTVRTALRARERQYQVCRELAARKRAEASLSTLNETLEERVEERTRQVRDLASMLTMAEQEERRRISRILHDDLQQHLYGIGMKMSFIRRHAEAGRTAQLLADIGEAKEWLSQGVEITRNLAVDLSPPILASEGLTDALRWLQSRKKKLYGLDVDIKAEHAFRTPQEDMRVLLFQIVRELLFNVAKHADTKQATVELKGTDHHVEIVVTDEGKGFDAEAVEEHGKGGFGLFSIRERLGLFGGTMEIDSRPGEGTRIVLSVPLQLE